MAEADTMAAGGDLPGRCLEGLFRRRITRLVLLGQALSMGHPRTPMAAVVGSRPAWKWSVL